MPSPSPRVRVVTAAFMIQGIVIGMMFGYGVFFKELQEELGWSRTLLSSASSLAVLVMGIFAVVAGQLSDRFGPRWVLVFSGLTTGIGYFWMSSMQATWQLLLGYGLLVGLGLATHDVVTLSTVSSWYPRRRGLVTGIVKTGSACGQILVPLLVTFLIAAWGWRDAMAFLGITAAVLLVALAQWVRKKVASPNGDQPSQTLGAIDGVSFKQAASNRTLWKLCAIQFCFLPSMMTVPLHIVPHATDLGMTRALAATVLSSLGAASIIGRLTVGHLVDRFGGRTILCTCLFGLMAGLLVLRLVESPWSLFLVAVVYGVAHGGLFTVVSPSVAEYFGMKSHGAIFGTVLFFGTVGGAAGPVIAGILFDRFGNYKIAFTILAVLALVGILLAWSLPKQSKPRTTIGRPIAGE